MMSLNLNSSDIDLMLLTFIVGVIALQGCTAMRR
jgi:hypothetical protein